MNLFNILGMFFILTVVIGINSAYAQVDPFSEILFLQKGELKTKNNEFLVSNELNIREFWNGNIIRISGQTIEGFPYITYSEISEDNIETRGIIFINGEFVELLFVEESTLFEEKEKQEDLALLVQYSQRVYSKQNIVIDIKLYDKEENKFNDFNQNYGYAPTTNVNLNITNQNQEIIFSSNGTTNERGFFTTQYLIPDNSPSETLTVSIIAENENSIATKILQVFALGNIPKDSN